MERDAEDPMWMELRQGLAIIFTGARLIVEHYPQHYSYVSFYCASLPYDCETSGDTDPVGIGIYKKGLRDFLCEYLQSLLEDCGDLTGEKLLKFYIRRWKMYLRSVFITCKEFRHFDRLWVREEDSQDSEEIKGIYKLALHSWKEIVLKTVNKQVLTALLDLIHRHRTGDSHHSVLIDDVIHHYMRLDTNDQTSEESTLEAYKEHFESAFLDSTEQFYCQEGSTFLQNYPVRSYLRKVESWLEAEEKFVQLHLPELTRQKLVTTCNTQLIGKHLQTLCGALPDFLENDDSEDVCRMYKLVSKAEGLLHLASRFREHIISRGEQAVEKCADAAIKDPNLYVQTVLAVHQKNATLTENCFKGDKLFVTAVEQACRRFMDYTVVSKATKSKCKPAELLARYCDTIITKSSDKPDEMKVYIDQAATVFKYINNKYDFQTRYLKLLTKRLVQLMPTSTDADTTVINRLANAGGAMYTSQLQQMIDEFTVGRIQQQQFQEILRNRGGPQTAEFAVQLYPEDLWPFKYSHDFILPPELEQNCRSFTQVYNERYKRRVLGWHLYMCSGEVVTNCFKKKYTIQVSVYQLAVLLLYNSADEYTYEQLLEATALQTAVLGPVLKRLLISKLLRRKDGGTVNEVLQNSTRLRLADDYKNKKQSININVPLKEEADEKRYIAATIKKL